LSTTFRQFYDTHVRFVWRAMLRLGVGENDVSDAVQEVFVVVYRKLPEFEARSKITTWLFGICMRIASDRRQRAHTRREVPSSDLASLPVEVVESVEALSDRERARELLAAILDGMPEEQRIVFSLFELEGLSGDAIAELLDVPTGTVRSRLRLARATLREAIARVQARERPRHGARLRTRLA
jgi:RNA polymerase sigma-70 factor (ECF subfamily)